MTKNVFEPAVSQELVERVNRLTPQSKPLWGKMSVSQMLAHCNVTYEMVYEDKHPKPKGLMKLFLKAFVKNVVVSETPYKHNIRTAPAFMVKDDKNFEAEKNRLVEYIQRTQQLGAQHFNGKDSHSFGPLTQQEWNNMFYKHLDHHFRQFGV